MSKNYAGLLSRLYGTPVLMAEHKFRVITEAVTMPLLLGQADQITRTPGGTNATTKEFLEEYKMQGRRMFIIPVFDSLVSKEVNAGSGMTSYQLVNKQIDAAVHAGATDIGFYLDSPGGEPSVFGLTEKIRQLPSRGIGTFSFCDMACSAGYAIAAATQRIYSTKVASLGSIGAIMVHGEMSKKAETEGTTYTVMRSKESKALGDPYSALSAAAKAHFTSMLETLDTAFNNDVVLSRTELSLEAIIALKGSELIGEAAVKAGLADALVPNLEGALSAFLKDSKTLNNNSTKPEVYMSQDTDLASQLATAKAKIVSLEAEAAAVATTMQASVDTAVALETDRIMAVLNSAQTLKLSLGAAIKYSAAKYSAEVALEVMTDLATVQDTDLDSSAPVDAGLETEVPEGNSLLASYQAATNFKEAK